MAEIDSLELKISAEVTKASTAINTLRAHLGKLSTALSDISSKPFKINIDMSAVKSLSDMQSAAQKALGNVKGDVGKIGEELAKSFNIDSKTAAANISKQFSDIMQSAVDNYNGKSFNFNDNAMQGLVDSITKSGKISKGAMADTLYGIEKEYQDFYDYFNSHKIYVSDFLKHDIGKTEFASLLETNLRNITTDATKGIPLNSYWEELAGRFPSILPQGVANAAEQVITVLQKINDVRDQIKPIPIESLLGGDAGAAADKIWDEVVNSTERARSRIVDETTKISNAPSDAFTPTININEEGIVSQIQSAIRKAAKVEYEPLKINLDVDVSKINTSLKEKLEGIDFSGFNSLNGLADSFNALGAAATENTEKVAALAKSLAAFGHKNVERSIENIPKLATEMQNLFTTLSRVPSVSQNTIQMTQALANLAAQGGRVGAASRNLIGGLNNSSKAMKNARGSAFSLAAAFGRIYATLWTAIRGVKTWADSVTRTTDYIESFNYATVAFGKIASEFDENWANYGSEGARNYSNAFVKGMNEMSSKLSGLTVDFSPDFKEGLLSESGLKNLGLNIQEVTQYAAQLASVTNSIGLTGKTSLAASTAFTKLAGDISSLFNMKYADAAQNIQSGLIGQSRAMYKYGIDITNATLQTYAYNMGIDKQISKMTQAEKMQLRMIAILDQSKVSWGDLANTINSPNNMLKQFENNVRELSMVFGQLFIPILSKVMPVVNGVTIAIKRLMVSVANMLGIKLDFSSFGAGYTKLEDDLDGIADGYEGVADAAKKAKTHVLAIDELNIAEPEADGGKGGAGAGGAGFDLTDEILKATAEYDKVWQDAFDKMQNEALRWANSVEQALQPVKDILEDLFVGDFGGAGENFGELLNSLISPEKFDNFGQKVAQGINNAVQFALGMGYTFDFVNLGNSLAAAANSFFKTLDTKSLAEAINVWVIGALKTVHTFFKETDFYMIGTKIGEFLANIKWLTILWNVGKAVWDAINAAIKAWSGSLSKAPLQTALATLIAFPTLLKAITSSELITGLKNLAQGFVLVVQGLGGNATSISTLTASYPALGAAVDVARQAIANFRFGIENGNFLTGLNEGLTTIRNNLTGLQKGAITAIAGFAEFNIVSNTIEGLSLGTENLVTGIAKIGGTVAIAAAAMYTALGPAGLAIAAITGVMAAVKGINDAIETVKAKELGDTIKNALSNPGGTPIEDLASGISDALSDAALGFSDFNTKSAELTTANTNIKNVVTEIEQIKRAMELGVLSVDEGKQKLDTLFEQLVTLTSQRMTILTTSLLALYGEGGPLSHAFDETKYSAQQLTDASIRAQYATTEAAQAIYDKMKEVEFGSSEWNELYVQLIRTSTGMEEFEKAAFIFSDDINKAGEEIDWELLLGTDGSVNTDYLDKILGGVSTSLDDYLDVLDKTEQDTKLYWHEMLANAATPEDKKLFQTMLDETPKQFERMRAEAKAQTLQFTNMLQTDLIGRMDTIVAQAKENWDKMSEWDKGKFEDIEDYVSDYVTQYQTKAIDPISSRIETMFSTLGIDGAGWASTATGKIVSSLFELKTTTNAYGESITEKTLSDKWQSIINNAQKTIQEGLNNSEYGKNIIKSITKGVDDPTAVNELLNTADSVMKKLDGKIHDGVWQFGSPSQTAMDYGGWIIEGFNQGITDNTDSSITAITEWATKISDAMKTALGIGDTATQGSTSASMFGGMLTNFETTWQTFSTKWTANLEAWKTTNDEQYFGEEVWNTSWLNFYNAYETMWADFTKLWQTNFKKWWSIDVEPFFSKKQWETFGTNMKDGIYTGFKGIVTQIGGVMNGLVDVFNSGLKNVADGINNIVNQFNGIAGQIKAPTLSKVSAPTISKVQIPAFKMGGFPEDGLFYANHNELVGRFTNGQTAVANNEMIVEGIATGVRMAVRDAVAEVLAPYLADIAQNTRETADKDMSVNIGDEDIVKSYRRGTERWGYNFS